MPNNRSTSTSSNGECIERVKRVKHVERNAPPSQTVTHRWEVTYTCTSGGEAQPPFRPVLVYSCQGGPDAQPTLCMAVERTGSRERRPQSGATAAESRACPPAQAGASRSTQAGAASRASSVVSYATAPRSPADDPASPMGQAVPQSSRVRSSSRAHNTDRRRSASPPPRNSDRSGPARRVGEMPSWRPSLNTRKIHGCDAFTEWTESHGKHPLRAMPAALLRNPRDPDGSRIPPGRLHVHLHNCGAQAWMLVWRKFTAHRECDSEPGSSRHAPQTADGQAGANPEPVHRRVWVPAPAGTKHPRLPGYVLHFLDRGEPSFIRAASARNYTAGRRKRERIAQTT